MVSPYLNIAFGPASPTTNSFRYGKTQLYGPYNPANLALVPTSGWGKVVRDARREARAMGGDGIILQHRSGALMTSHKVTMLVFRLPDEKPAP